MCDDQNCITNRETLQVLENLRVPCKHHDDLVIAIGTIGQNVDALKDGQGKVQSTLEVFGNKLDHLKTTTLGPNLNGREGVVGDIAEHEGDIRMISADVATMKRIMYGMLLSVVGLILALGIHHVIE